MSEIIQYLSFFCLQSPHSWICVSWEGLWVLVSHFLTSEQKNASRVHFCRCLRCSLVTGLQCVQALPPLVGPPSPNSSPEVATWTKDSWAFTTSPSFILNTQSTYAGTYPSFAEVLAFVIDPFRERVVWPGVFPGWKTYSFPWLCWLYACGKVRPFP